MSALGGVSAEYTLVSLSHCPPKLFGTSGNATLELRTSTKNHFRLSDARSERNDSFAPNAVKRGPLETALSCPDSKYTDRLRRWLWPLCGRPCGWRGSKPSALSPWTPPAPLAAL